MVVLLLGRVQSDIRPSFISLDCLGFSCWHFKDNHRKMNQDQIAYIIKDVLHALIYLQVVFTTIVCNVNMTMTMTITRRTKCCTEM